MRSKPSPKRLAPTKAIAIEPGSGTTEDVVDRVAENDVVMKPWVLKSFSNPAIVLSGGALNCAVKIPVRGVKVDEPAKYALPMISKTPDTPMGVWKSVIGDPGSA